MGTNTLGNNIFASDSGVAAVILYCGLAARDYLQIPGPASLSGRGGINANCKIPNKSFFPNAHKYFSKCTSFLSKCSQIFFQMYTNFFSRCAQIFFTNVHFSGGNVCAQGGAAFQLTRAKLQLFKEKVYAQLQTSLLQPFEFA